MTFRAKVYNRRTGEFIVSCLIDAATLREAEQRAIAKAAFATRGDPSDMLVRQMHEVPTQEVAP